MRGKSIRRKIGALLLVPLLSLVSIWAFATAITVAEARSLLAVASVSDRLGTPAESVIHAIQQERRQTLVFLADPRRSDALAQLRTTQESTDSTVAEVREEAAGGARDDLNGGAKERLDAFLSGLDGLAALRDQVHSNTISRTAALDAYTVVIDPGFRFLAALHLVENVDLDRHGRAVVGIAQAREYLSREDALVAGALAAGRITDTELRQVGDRITERDLAYTTYLPDLPLHDQQAHDTFWDTGPGHVLTVVEGRLLDGGTRSARADQWVDTGGNALEQLRSLGESAQERYQDAVDPEATAVLVRAGAAGVLGAAAVILSLVVSLRIGSALIRDLMTLSKEAKDAAEVRLPGVLRRLAAGERVDVETEAPHLEYGRDEVGQVGQSLNTLQRAAVAAAVEQATVRRGISDVLVNLARRNQVLLHRQLGLLDAMERRTDDADELADLFRLDHLTTRMRRHAEGLVILSGAAPARQWRKPVQLMDVVRASVAEVEDYERVELHRMPQLAVAGGAVADLTHLIAELLENATVFSPPHTAVQVSGERVPHGYTLEIHDRGLGMTAEALHEANERLAHTPEFDLSDTDRLGLFVVSRLAERHGVRVSLKESPYGGTTAVVLLPGELLTETGDSPGERNPLPERPAPPELLNGPVDGPVELEAPVGFRSLEHAREGARGFGPYPFPDDDDDGDDGRRGERPRHARPDEYPAHHEPSAYPAPPRPAEPVDQAEHTTAADPAPPIPLPQRRRTPVLVADHGRQVGEPPGEENPAPGHQEEDGGGTTVAGLPRRQRRTPPASAPAAVPDTWDDEEAGAHATVTDLTEQDADEVRARMAALQLGWRRGRQHNDHRDNRNDTRRDDDPQAPTP
ncbi:nitrate- and nitrite sensing domain-containing protein [Streptomyces xiamenensis]|uniref:sensor histidine kinase n=1 Tax=Streptomyces xiamenensis TaxID=408015 RepID=UPI0034159475